MIALANPIGSFIHDFIAEYGVNLLSCLIRYGDISLPVGYELVKKDVLFCDIQSKRQKRKASVTKNQQFRYLVEQAVIHQIPFDYILADNWFGAKANMAFIHHELNKRFIIGIKANRLVTLNKQDGQFQSIKSLTLEEGHTKTLWLKGLDFPVRLLKKVFTNDDGSTGILYLVTNDLTLSADRLYEVYQKRWRIEEYHKIIKQQVSLAKSPTKTLRSQANHVFATLIGFCKLEMLKVKTALNHFAIKFKLFLKANQAALKELQKLTATGSAYVT